MNKILQFVIFFSIFFTVYFGMHFYVFSRMSTLLSIRKNLWFYMTMIILALSFPLISILERFYATGISRAAYIAAGVWLGTLFLTFCVLITYELLKLVIKFDKHAAGITILILVSAIAIYGIINAMTITVREVEIPMPNLEKELKIVQLSDTHIGTVHDWGYINKIVEETNKLNPDIVLITGDLYDGSRKINENIITPLNKIKAKTFFVTGNHDLFQGVDEVINLLKKTKIQVLGNEATEYMGVQIVGMDNPQNEFSKTDNTLEQIKIDKTKPSILMYHPPSKLEEANKAGINLQLSGHTHHGQIFPFTLMSMIVYPRNKGLFNYNGTYMYVTEGAGTWGPLMRIGTRNEITLIRLVKA